MKEKIANFINNIKKNNIKNVATPAKTNQDYNNNLTLVNLKALILKNLFQFLGISFLL